MALDIALVILGLSMLVAGGEVMIRGATGLAAGLGVSPLAIGLTVVAFGTSAPELAVNVNAALAGKGGVSFGNIIGSNMANIGLILGLTALIKPIALRRSFVSRELPMMLLATIATLIMGFDRVLGRGPDRFSLMGSVAISAVPIRLQTCATSSGYASRIARSISVL